MDNSIKLLNKIIEIKESLFDRICNDEFGGIEKCQSKKLADLIKEIERELYKIEL